MNDVTTPPTAEPYMIDDSGKLFRQGVHIGNLEGEAMKLLPDHQNYRASVTRWLREKADEEETKPEVPARVFTEDEKKAEDAKLIEAARAAAGTQVESWKDDVAFAKRTGCPPPPKKNPRFGDKTPAYVDWLHKHRLEKFKTTFQITGKGKRAIWKTNPENGIEEVVGYEDVWIGGRKTHLSDVSDDNKGLSDDMDWEA